jgi:polysaccharide biosynthesis/export protein
MFREKMIWWAFVLFMASVLMGSACASYAQQVQVTPIPGSVSSPGSPSLPEPPLPQPSQLSPKRASGPEAPIQQKKGEVQAALPKSPSAADGTSEFEQFINKEAEAKSQDGKDAQPGEKGIRQFGYDLFSAVPSTFAPAEEVPVGPDYVVGPGDEIRVSVWGSIEGQWSSVVDRNGTVNLPKVGTIGVTGLTFDQLKVTLRKEISKYYTGFQMNVSMGPLRSMRIYVVGNAHRPGSYTVSSLSTLVSALFASGGPSKTGSMRAIRVERNGQVMAVFDLYDLLLKGNKSGDIRLMSEDVVFIPPVGPLVGISGSVNTPAIYELKGEKKLSELIAMAGGLSTVAFVGRVQMERIVDGRTQTLIDADLSSLRDTDLTIQSGDLFRIFQVFQDRKVVRLMGAVNRPGEYGFNPGMRVKDLIDMAGGLRYYAYRKEVELTRVTVVSTGPRTEKIVINLEQALGGKEDQNIPLKEDDYLFVHTVPEWDLYRTVEVTGEVRFPGTFTIVKGERLSSLIERAGGYTDKAYLRGAIFVREQVKELQQKGIEEMVARMQRDLLAQSSTQLSTSLSPEEVEAKKGELEAKQKFIQALRDLKATGRMTIKLAHVRLLKGSEYDIELEDGDKLFIPTRSSVVNVMGSVMSLSSHIYREKFTYKDYIAMSGGYTPYADKASIYVLKVDGSARRVARGLFNWNDSRSRWEVAGFDERDKEIEPGDTIIVPEKFDRIAWLREVKDITQILMQTAVTAGVVIELLNND